MDLGKLEGVISRTDREQVKDMRNPPQFEPGFDGSSSDSSSDGFADLFDSFDDSELDSSGDSLDSIFGGGSNNSSDGQDIFGGSSTDIFGGNSQGGFGQNGFGNSNPFGDNQTKTEEPKKNDILDKALETSGKSLASLGKLLIEVVKSIKNRSADDFGYLSRNLMICGISVLGSGVLIGLIGLLRDIKYISFGAFPGHFIISGLMAFGTGLAGLGFSAISILKCDKVQEDNGIETVSNISESFKDDATEEIESNETEDIFDSMFDDMFDDLGEDEGKQDEFRDFDSVMPSSDTEDKGLDEPVFAAPVKVDFSKKLSDVAENQYLSRELLLRTFKAFFPCNTPNFQNTSEIDPESNYFNSLETMCIKAIANVAKCDINAVTSRIESAVETYFSYELRVSRMKGIKNTEDIEKEIIAYVKAANDGEESAVSVEILGDYYKIIISKNETAVITYGDLFSQQDVYDKFLNPKMRLPIIIGITELGKPIVSDAKVYDTMMITGKPRSGKSWYTLSILAALAFFNTPEDVQFVIIDPKKATLFNTFALLPHVAGLHDDSNILDILNDIIDNEAPRRKELLSSNRCDDIWALRAKGIKLPILYIVIDEYITVQTNLGVLAKEFDSKIRIVISQLPSLGIRLLFVPHRSTGVVDKTNRTLLQFTASVKGEIEEVKNALGVQKWTRPLINQGDIAVKASDISEAMFVRSAALSTSDEENNELIKNIARAFYKMGVDLPDMSAMSIACNRDEDYIRDELQDDSTRIQYDNWQTSGD